jgi:hypothetical protein
MSTFFKNSDVPALWPHNYSALGKTKAEADYSDLIHTELVIATPIRGGIFSNSPGLDRH